MPLPKRRGKPEQGAQLELGDRPPNGEAPMIAGEFRRRRCVAASVSILAPGDASKFGAQPRRRRATILTVSLQIACKRLQRRGAPSADRMRLGATPNTRRSRLRFMFPTPLASSKSIEHCAISIESRTETLRSATEQLFLRDHHGRPS
jgi:hypothetical protein